jgi:predicted flavoprotein YhiN
MRFIIEVIIIGGGLPGFLGASSSGSLRVHVSSSERCEKLRVKKPLEAA